MPFNERLANHLPQRPGYYGLSFLFHKGVPRKPSDSLINVFQQNVIVFLHLRRQGLHECIFVEMGMTACVSDEGLQIALLHQLLQFLSEGHLQIWSHHKIHLPLAARIPLCEGSHVRRNHRNIIVQPLFCLYQTVGKDKDALSPRCDLCHARVRGL